MLADANSAAGLVEGSDPNELAGYTAACLQFLTIAPSCRFSGDSFQFCSALELVIRPHCSAN